MLSKLARTIDRLQFRQKLRLAPTVAAIALGLIFATNLLLGLAVRRQEARIQQGYYPSVQLSGQLTELLVSTQRALQDAAAAGDPERLAAADSIRSVFMGALRAAQGNKVMERATFDSLGQAYSAYYELARATTERTMSGKRDLLALTALRQMMQSHNALRTALEKNRADNTEQINRAFHTLGVAQVVGWVATALLTVLCVAMLVWLSRLTSRSLTAPVEEAVRVANALAVGDVGVSIDIQSDDELGRLLRSMQEMVRYLQETAALAERIGQGEVHVQITPRSDRDAFGNALVTMTQYLSDMARVADEISAGRLDAQVHPRSKEDRFGHAFVAMTQSLSELIGDAYRRQSGRAQRLHRAHRAGHQGDGRRRAARCVGRREERRGHERDRRGDDEDHGQGHGDQPDRRSDQPARAQRRDRSRARGPAGEGLRRGGRGGAPPRRHLAQDGR
jgi:HAMP domain-containing protein